MRDEVRVGLDGGDDGVDAALAVEEGLDELGVVPDRLQRGRVAQDLVDELGRDAAAVRLRDEQLQDGLNVEAGGLDELLQVEGAQRDEGRLQGRQEVGLEANSIGVPINLMVINH